MNKILLAIGHNELEKYIEKTLKNEFTFIGTTVYREGIIRSIGQKNPDIVVIRELLPGNENISKIIDEIRTSYPKIRIVFIGSQRNPGDPLLASLVNCGVYDFIQGEKVNANDIIALIRKPNEYQDVKRYQPITIVDESSNEVIFKAPASTVIEKEVVIVKEVIKDAEVNSEKTESSESTEYKDLKKDDKSHNKLPIFATKVTKKEKPSVVTSKQKVITFIGSKSGVGNTSIAINTAITLAKKKHKVIYLEINESTPSVPYWFELGMLDKGIETALQAINEDNYKNIDEAIIASLTVKNTEKETGINYKYLPDTLDFMFFSENHLLNIKSNSKTAHVNYECLKEMYLYLMLHLNYDYIILDVPHDMHYEATKISLVFSNQIFLTLTQDISTIGNSIFTVRSLKSNGIELENKLHYIINKYENAELSLRGIEEWLRVKDLISVPCANKEFVNSFFIGIPIVNNKRNAALKSAFDKITKAINN